jgi:hypothetical protein
LHYKEHPVIAVDCTNQTKLIVRCAFQMQSTVVINPVMRGIRVLQTVALCDRNGLQRKTVLRGIP